jgi:hypothetical protein
MPLSPAQCPAWLATVTRNAPTIDIEQFFASPVVFYPRGGGDGHPLRVFAEAHAAHCFLYVDDRYQRDQVLQMLDGHLQGEWARAQGYQTYARVDVSPDLLSSGAAAGMNAPAREPWAILEVLERADGFDDNHGPHRLALLFACLDGNELFNAAFARRRCSPFAIVLQDDGGQDDDERVGRGGLLDLLAGNARPDWLVVGAGTDIWDGYAHVEDCADGGPGFVQRALYQRNALAGRQTGRRARAPTLRDTRQRAIVGAECLFTLLRRVQGEFVVIAADDEQRRSAEHVADGLRAALAPFALPRTPNGARHVVLVAHRGRPSAELLATFEATWTRWVTLLVPARNIVSPDSPLRRAITRMGAVRSIVWMGDVVGAVLGDAATTSSDRDYALLTVERNGVDGGARLGAVSWGREENATVDELLAALDEHSVHKSSKEISEVRWTHARFSPRYEEFQRRVRLVPIREFVELTPSTYRGTARVLAADEATNDFVPLLEREALRRALVTSGRRPRQPRRVCPVGDMDDRCRVREGDVIAFQRDDGGIGAFLVGPENAGWAFGRGLVRLRFRDDWTPAQRRLLLAQLVGVNGRLLLDAAGFEFTAALEHVEVVPPARDAEHLLEVLRPFIGLGFLD